MEEPKKKKFENYCITRIYHLLNREDIQFITQQMFKRDNRNIALADLYLPQINLIIEIDEDHHVNNEKLDKKRTEEIIKNKIKYFEEIIIEKLEIERINVHSNSLKEINLRIDEIVKIINKKIQNLEKKNIFVPWKVVYSNTEDYIKKKYIDIQDKPVFRTIYEVSKLFNKDYKPGCQKCWFKDKPNSKIMIWCPKLKINGLKYNVEWKNEIDEDGKTIYVSSNINHKHNYLYHIKLYNENYTTRYVFTKFRNSTGMDLYRFRGVFKFNIGKAKAMKKEVWEKVEDKISLTDYFTSE